MEGLRSYFICMAKEHLQETIIAQAVRVEGDFVSEGDVTIEGEVKGSVKTKTHLRVGETARIHADVTAKSATVAGEIHGNVVVEDRLELGEHSVVKGNVTTQVLSVAPGAQVNGVLTMGGGTPKMEREEDVEM